MKIIPALFFIAIGIFIAFRFPDFATSAYTYIEVAWLWIKGLFSHVSGGGI